MDDRISRYIIDRKQDIKFVEVEERLVKLKPTKDFILTILGPRRAGKTYLLYHFIKKNELKDEDYLFVNFEEIEENLDKLMERHQEIYGRYPLYLFLDEIQNLPEWEKALYRMYEKKRFFIFVTGSSSKLLSREIATQLRGRSLKVNLWPFSFTEILHVHRLKKKFYSSEETGKIKRILKFSKKRVFPEHSSQKDRTFEICYRAHRPCYLQGYN